MRFNALPNVTAFSKQILYNLSDPPFFMYRFSHSPSSIFAAFVAMVKKEPNTMRANVVRILIIISLLFINRKRIKRERATFLKKIHFLLNPFPDLKGM